MFAACLQGFTLSAGLIIAIGGQNAFVLRQGLRREYVFTVCTICFVCDAVLIVLGVCGVGALVASSPHLISIARWAGATFLFGYGALTFRSAFMSSTLQIDNSINSSQGLQWVVATTFVLTLLNPHVYLDTIVLLGSIAGQLDSHERLAFAAGAVSASLIWFYGLGYGARILAPVFSKPAAWRILDLMIGIIMWVIAGSLLWPLFFE